MKASSMALVFAFVLGGVVAAQAQTPPPGGAPAGKFKDACAADLQKFCPAAQDRKAQHQCIKQNKANVSQTCSAFLAAKKAEKQQEKAEQSTAPATGTPPPAGH
jgi:hypothetical protein